MWEVLLEDETRKNIKENMWRADEKITTAKAEMKKLSLKEKVKKMVDTKQLQQEVKFVCDEEYKRNNEIIEHQSEEKRVIGLLHPIQ